MCHHGQVAVVPLKHDHLVLSRPLKLPEKTYFLLEKLLFKTAPDSLSAFLSEIWSLCFFSFWATLWAEAKVSLQLAVSFTLAAQDQFQHLPLISFFLFLPPYWFFPPQKYRKHVVLAPVSRSLPLTCLLKRQQHGATWRNEALTSNYCSLSA